MLNNLKNIFVMNRRGFTLVEVITALSIIMVGIISAYGLVNQTLSASTSASISGISVEPGLPTTVVTPSCLSKSNVCSLTVRMMNRPD